jgi:uncharacterized protein with GYD domain
MATYVVLVNLTDQGIKDVKGAPKRVDALEETLKKAGGKLVGFYAVMGRYDYVAIAEGPDDETAMAQALALGMLGNVRTTTLRAFNRQEFAKIVQKLP